MLKIYKTVAIIAVDRFANSSSEFKAGFSVCMNLFKLGMQKSISYNSHYRIEELEIEHKKLRRENSALREQLEKLQEKDNQTFLVSFKPMKEMKEYEFESGFGIFKIAINADFDTSAAFYYRFVSQTVYKSKDECKSKFLSFLKSFKEKGFTPYKDLKTAKKEERYDNKQRKD